jgi:hypothetical protein
VSPIRGAFYQTFPRVVAPSLYRLDSFNDGERLASVSLKIGVWHYVHFEKLKRMILKSTGLLTT